MHSLLSLSVFCFALLDQVLGQNGTSTADKLDKYFKVYEEGSLRRLTNGRSGNTQLLCTEENIRVRKSWSHLSLLERKEYLDAVVCLHGKPAVTPLSFAPGARNAVDDFTVSHINQTLFIHSSGWLMPWHRYFVWQWENALRDECGYTGYQPYWDWTEDTDGFALHPLFDGSEYSIGGNGLYVEHPTANGTVPGLPAPHVVTRPSGTGGGCVVDGPLANLTLHLGPIFPYGDSNLTEQYQYRPHCLTRDFLEPLAKQFLSNASVVDLLSQTTMADFRNTMDNGIHFAGHSSVGGDMSDIFSSPQDPAFFFHHAQMDRLWTIWQEQSACDRLYATSDTQTYYNSPPSPNATISDTLDFGYVGGQLVMASVMDVIGGSLCYRYE